MSTIFPDVRIVEAMFYGGWERNDNTWRLSGSSLGNINRDACVDWLGDAQDLPTEDQIIIWYDEWAAQESAIDAIRTTNIDRIADINENGSSKNNFDNLLNTLELLRNYVGGVPSISAAFTTLRLRLGSKPAHLVLADNFVEGIYNLTLPVDPDTASDDDKRIWVQGAWIVVLTLALESSISLGDSR